MYELMTMHIYIFLNRNDFMNIFIFKCSIWSIDLLHNIEEMCYFVWLKNATINWKFNLKWISLLRNAFSVRIKLYIEPYHHLRAQLINDIALDNREIRVLCVLFYSLFVIKVRINTILSCRSQTTRRKIFLYRKVHRSTKNIRQCCQKWTT